MPTDRDNAAFTRDDLIERSTVFQFHRDNLITDACLFRLFQVTRKLAGNWNQAFTGRLWSSLRRTNATAES